MKELAKISIFVELEVETLNSMKECNSLVDFELVTVNSDGTTTKNKVEHADLEEIE